MCGHFTLFAVEEKREIDGEREIEEYFLHIKIFIRFSV